MPTEYNLEQAVRLGSFKGTMPSESPLGTRKTVNEQIVVVATFAIRTNPNAVLLRIEIAVDELISFFGNPRIILKVGEVSEQPVNILKKTGEISFPFTIKENVTTITNLSLEMRREE